MMKRNFEQVDVFTVKPYMGNPVAVVFDAAGLLTDEMARFANWTNLSETTFICPPTEPSADYLLRIFTPSQELSFAGHPTLGSCHAWLRSGGKPKSSSVVQQCAAGLIEIRNEGDILSFAAPKRQRSGPLVEASLKQIIAGLNISSDDIIAHEWCDNGPPWQTVLLRSDELVLNAKPNPQIIKDIDFLGLVGPSNNSPFAFEVRAFFPSTSGLTEDPVTGSLNAAIAQWLIGHGLAPKNYMARQGTALNRCGIVHLNMDEMGQVWVGGQSVSCITGTVAL
jgi:PhzF family phenazine biosynthesis protein